MIILSASVCSSVLNYTCILSVTDEIAENVFADITSGCEGIKHADHS